MKTMVGAAEPPDRGPAVVFDAGGILPTGGTWLVNNTGQPIAVTSTLTPARLRAMHDRLSGGR